MFFNRTSKISKYCSLSLLLVFQQHWISVLAAMRVHFRTKQRQHQNLRDDSRAALKQQRVRSRLDTVHYILKYMQFCFFLISDLQSNQITIEPWHLLELWWVLSSTLSITISCIAMLVAPVQPPNYFKSLFKLSLNDKKQDHDGSTLCCMQL